MSALVVEFTDRLHNKASINGIIQHVRNLMNQNIPHRYERTDHE